MRSVNIHDAKTNLSKLVERASTSGESFIIAKAGKPLVRVVPLTKADRPKSRVGFLKGRYRIPDDIKSIGRDEIPALFEGTE